MEKSWTIDGISYSQRRDGVRYGPAKSAVQALSPAWLPFPALAEGYGKAHISVLRKRKADGENNTSDTTKTCSGREYYRCHLAEMYTLNAMGHLPLAAIENMANIANRCR